MDENAKLQKFLANPHVQHAPIPMTSDEPICRFLYCMKQAAHNTRLIRHSKHPNLSLVAGEQEVELNLSNC